MCLKNGLLRFTINRTILELKQESYEESCCEYYSINRTILELKQVSSIQERLRVQTINRTILELKLNKIGGKYVDITLLIEPFWN